MVFWTSFWVQFWYQPLSQKIEEDKKKKQKEKYMTEIPGNNVVWSISENEKINITEKQKPTIPMVAMQSYVPKVENESKKFPWLSVDDEEYIQQRVSAWDVEEDVYKEAIEMRQEESFLKDREDMRKKIISWKMSLWDKEKDNIVVRQSQLADMIRIDALKNWVIWFSKKNDEDILKKAIWQRPELIEPVNAFINWQLNIKEINEIVFSDNYNWLDKKESPLWNNAIKWAIWRWWISLWKAEGVVNPIWRIMEIVDNNIQWVNMWVTWKKSEEKRKERIANLTPEERQKFEQKFNKSKFLQWLYWDVDTYIWEATKTLRDQIIWTWDKWPNVAKIIMNIPQSIVKTATSIARAATNPADTLMWLWQIIFTKEWRQAILDRYWSLDTFAETLNNDPIWVASDVLSVVEWWAKLSVKLWMWWVKIWWTTIKEVWDVANKASSLWMYWIKDTILWGLKKATKDVPVVGKVTDLAVWLTEPLKYIKTIKKWWNVNDIKLTDEKWDYIDWENAIRWDRTIRKLWDYITPDYNKRQSAEITKKVNTKRVKIWWKQYLVPTNTDIEYLDVASKYTDLQKNIDYNVENYKKWILQLWDNIEKTITNNDKPINYAKLQEKIDSIERSIELAWDEVANKTIDAWKDLIFDMITKEWDTNLWLYNVRKKYREYLKTNTTAFKNPDKAVNKYLIAMWNKINEYLWDVYWDKYTKQLKEQAILFNILDNTAWKTTKLKSTDIWRFINKYENEIKALSYWLWLWYAWVMWIKSIWE